MANIEETYKSKDNKIKYQRRMDRPSEDQLNQDRVFLTDEEQDKMIPFLHKCDYPERQMRKIRNKRNIIISCDYDNAVLVWKNKSDKKVDSNQFTVTTISFNARSEADEEATGQTPHEGSCYEENARWDSKRIIDRDDKKDKHDNKNLEPTRRSAIYAMEDKFPNLRRLIQVDIYAHGSESSNGLKNKEVTNMDTIIDAINMSDSVLLAWGGPIPDWENIDHKDLEKALADLAKKPDKVFWLGEIREGQPVHANGLIKGGIKLRSLDSTIIENIFNKKPSTK